MPRRKKSPGEKEPTLPGLLLDCSLPKQRKKRSMTLAEYDRKKGVVKERMRTLAARKASGIASLERRLMVLRQAPDELFQPLGAVSGLPGVIKGVQTLEHYQPLELSGHRYGLSCLGRWYTASGYTSWQAAYELNGTKVPVTGRYHFCGFTKKDGWLIVNIFFDFRNGQPVIQAVSLERCSLPKILQLDTGLTHVTLGLWLAKIEKELGQLQSKPRQKTSTSHHQVG